MNIRRGYVNFVIATGILALSSGCGGGAGSSTDRSGSVQSSSSVSVSSAVSSFSSSSVSSSVAVNRAVMQGTLSAFYVEGLGYLTSTGLTGSTEIIVGSNDLMGMPPFTHFLMHVGDDVVFSFGSLDLPKVPGWAFPSFFEIFSTRNQKSNVIINFMRLLLTVSTVTDGPLGTRQIKIPERYSSHAYNVYVTLDNLYASPDVFEQSSHVHQFLSLISPTATLVSTDIAYDFFYSSMTSSYAVSTGVNCFGVYFECDDDDGDGVVDSMDAFPWDADQSTDSNMDGIGDSNTTHYFELPFVSYSDFDDAGNLPRFYHQFEYVTGKKYLLATDQGERAVAVISGETGEVVKKITFNYVPQKIRLARDEKTLYVALGVPSSVYKDKFLEDDGYVAAIDMDTLTQKNLIRLQFFPFDLIAGPSNTILLSAYQISGGVSSLYLYDRESGVLLDKYDGGDLPILSGTYFGCSTKCDLIFAASSTFRTLDVSDQKIKEITEVNSGAPIIGYNDLGGRFWVTPDGQYAIGTDANVFSMAAHITVRYLEGAHLFFPGLDVHAKPVTESVDFDETKNLLFVGGDYGRINYYDASTFELAGYIPVNPMFANSVGITNTIFVDLPRILVVQQRIDGTTRLIVKSTM